MMDYALHGIFSLTPKWCQENGCSKRSSVNDQKYCPCLGDWLRLSFYNDSPLKKTTTSPETSQLISRLLGTGLGCCFLLAHHFMKKIILSKHCLTRSEF